MPERAPKLKLPIDDRRDRRSAGTSATPEEAAAVVAALERFMRATALTTAPATEPVDPWRRMAILEGVERAAQGDLGDPWLRV